MNQMKSHKRVIRARIKERILYPFAVIFIILLIYFFSFGFTIEQLEFIAPYFILVIIAQYFINFQYEVTVIDLNEESLRIRFPLSLYLKDRSFALQIIDRIEIESRPGTRAVPRLFITKKNGKRVKFHYSGHDDDTKIIVEYFKSYGIEVDMIKKYII
jgi:hypothetical protein